MRPFWASAVLAVAAGLCLPVWAPASAWGQAARADIRVSDVEVSDRGTVTAIVAVPDLRASDVNPTDAFEVWEEGEEREVDAVPVAAGDLEVILVVDTSAEQSVQQRREVQSIAMELALRLPRGSPVALVAMGHPAALAQTATTDVLERAAAVGHLEPGGERAAYGALALAMDEPSRLPDARRSIVVIGSGEDQASQAAQDDVLEQLRAANAALYVIQPAAERTDSHALDDLATATGGLLVAVEDDGDPLDAAAVVLADLLHQYRLTFETQGGGDRTASLRVATETVNAETTVTVPLPASTQPTEAARAVNDTEVVAAPPGSPSEVVPNWGWLLVAAAAVVVAVGGARLVLVRTGRAGPNASGAAGASARAGAGGALVAVVPGPGALRRSPAPTWRDAAAQVHREVGGDREAVHEAAERIESARHRTAAYLRAAGLDARLAAITLTPLPVIMVALRQILDPAYIGRLTAGPVGWLSLVAAGALTITGALWLRRVAKPPFAATPARWRTYDELAERWQRSADTLDRARLYAIAGLDLEHALQRALPDEHQPARWLVETLRPSHPGPEPVDDLLRTPGRAAVLLSGSPEGGSPADLLAAAQERLHAARMFAADVQAERLPVAMFVPFVVCILPATLVAGLMAWS